jgi:hypothetical protein
MLLPLTLTSQRPLLSLLTRLCLLLDSCLYQYTCLLSRHPSQVRHPISPLPVLPPSSSLRDTSSKNEQATSFANNLFCHPIHKIAETDYTGVGLGVRVRDTLLPSQPLTLYLSLYLEF